MKITTRLLFIAALFALVLPFVFTGNAGAVVYNPDGLVLNGTTGLWELPDNSGAAQFMGCFDGTTTINPAATRFACRNVAVPSRTTASACAATGVAPAGWNATASVARWSGCSEGGYSVNSSDPATDCVLAGGGTTNVFTRCNRSPQGTDCTTLPGYTFSLSGTTPGNQTCSTTSTVQAITAADCAAISGTYGAGIPYLGSASVSGGVTTCTIYIGNDATACAAVATGTISTTNTDETRGYCGGNWVFKAGTTGNWGSSVRNNCVKCHQPAYMDGATASPAGAVAKYANASHKNASRKIVPGQQQANVYLDTDGAELFGVYPYMPGLNSPQTDSTVSPNFNIRMVDWVNGKIEDTTTNASHVGLRNLPTGVYTEWYWEFGYYGVDPERGVYNGAAGANGKPSAKMQACFACHATNYEGSATVDATKEPAKSFPGIHWDGVTTYAPSSRPGVVNMIGAMTDRTTNVKTTTTYGKWDEYGVVCSRCHNSAGGSHTSGGTGAANPTTGLTVNAVCGQCHIRAGSGDYAVTAGTGVLTTRAQVGTGHPNYHETDFLNSPHARFTGTYGQVATASAYNSQFMVDEAGCVGCHNPHGSAREELHHLATGNAAPLEGIENACADCHDTVTTFRHPTDPNKPTPWAHNDACVVCHMPSGRHMFRITTDVNYTMTAPTAFPAKADGTYAEAVWVDLKASCQQCHGLHVSDDIPFIQTADLRDFANGFHGGSPTPEAFAVTITPTKTNLHVDFTATGCPAGKTCDYKWNFGDGASSIILGSAGATTSHNYAAAGNYSAQVIIVNTTDSNNAAKATAFSLTSGNTPPVPAATMTQSGWNVAITNTSTDAQTATSALGVFIQCGYSAGTPSAPVTVSGTGAGPFTCAYTTAGSYVIRMTVTDTAGAKRSINIAASVPVKYSVGGSVMRLDGATPVAGASIRLKLGTQVVKMTTTNALGAYTLQNVLPGNYTVQAVKSGLGFSSTPAAVVTNANLTGINITANR